MKQESGREELKERKKVSKEKIRTHDRAHTGSFTSSQYRISFPCGSFSTFPGLNYVHTYFIVVLRPFHTNS